MALLYGRAGRFNTKNAGFRPGQSWEMLYNPITVGARRYHGSVPLKPPFTDTELIWGGSLRQTLM
jgi:hypothetical protein